MPKATTVNVGIDITTYWLRSFTYPVDTKVGLYISAPLNLREIALEEFAVV